MTRQEFFDQIAVKFSVRKAEEELKKRDAIFNWSEDDIRELVGWSVKEFAIPSGKVFVIASCDDIIDEFTKPKKENK